MTVRIRDPYDNYHFTRRSIFIGAAASIISAPAIVRATSLMSVRCLTLDRALPIGRQYAGFCERLMYQSLADNLRADKMTTVVNGTIVAKADAHRLVAHARKQGWLMS
jgi:hypothetical protein